MTTTLTIVHTEIYQESPPDHPEISSIAIRNLEPQAIKEIPLESDWYLFVPEKKISLELVNWQKVLDQLTERNKAAILPYSRKGNVPMAVELLPAQFAVLIMDPFWLGLPILHRSLIPSITNANQGNSIWHNFVLEALENHSVQALEASGEFSLEEEKPYPELAPGRPSGYLAWLRHQIMNTPTGRLISKPDTSTECIATRAGLLQFHDELDASHQCSQSREGEQLADHWHGIMHRREPDDSNSKYWYRRVGHSPIFPELAKRASVILSESSSPEAQKWSGKLNTKSGWDSFAFVDFCSQCRKTNNAELTKLAEKIQYIEMLLLLRETC